MAKRILFWPDISYEPGHWRPVMSIAEKFLALNEEGHESDKYEFAFLCTPECKPIVRRHNIDWRRVTIFPDLYPEGYSSLASERPEEANSRMEHCLRIAEGELDSIIQDYRPDIIVAGFFVSMEALLLRYRLNIPIVITTTYLRHPNEDPAVTSMQFLAFHSQEISSRLMNAAHSSGNYNGSMASITKFVEPLTKVPELITCPEELDYPDFVDMHRKLRTNTSYVEPCILIDPVSIKENSSDIPPYENHIYASAGSRGRDYVESAKKLFKILVDTAGTPMYKNRQFLLAVGYTLKEEFKHYSDQTNHKIDIVEWANQVENLKRAKSAVIHGGLATIKECIYFGVPMIVVPFGKDQMDNALRIRNNGVGVLQMIDLLDDERMKITIEEVETDDKLKEKLGRMQKIFEAKEIQKPSINIIRNVISNGNDGGDEE